MNHQGVMHVACRTGAEQAAILSRHYVFGQTKHEAGVERDTQATGEGAENQQQIPRQVQILTS